MCMCGNLIFSVGYLYIGMLQGCFLSVRIRFTFIFKG
jgi:hypothetical protein